MTSLPMIATVREKIHHGRYINYRVGVLRSLDEAAVKQFMSGSPYAAAGDRTDFAANTVLVGLADQGRVEWGWATYTLHMLPVNPVCEYYAMCENDAVGIVNVRVIDNPVPVCQRCADKHNLEVVKFSQEVTKSAVDLESKFTVVRESNGDAKMIETYELGTDDTPERNLWAVQDIDKSCEHDMIDQGCEECNQDMIALPGVQAQNSDILYYLVTEEEWTDEDKGTEYVY